jgi:hypothetical protein
MKQMQKNFTSAFRMEHERPENHGRRGFRDLVLPPEINQKSRLLKETAEAVRNPARNYIISETLT